MAAPTAFDQFLAYAVESCVNGSSGRFYAVGAELPCIDDPPPGTVCPKCGKPVQLWKPIACYSDDCDYREEGYK